MSTRLVAAWLLVASACGTTDDRPLDAQFVTEAVLAPSCGMAQCHSAFKQAGGRSFDSLVEMRRSIVDFGLVTLDSLQFDPRDPARAALTVWVTAIDPFRRGIGRMPLDAPLADADVEYLKRWIVGPVEIRDDRAACSRTIACDKPDASCHYDGPDAATGNCVAITYLAPAKGAQCNPESFGGLACNNRTLVRCDDDWNFGSVVMECPGDCTQGACL